MMPGSRTSAHRKLTTSIMAETAEWYRAFAEREVRGVSPRYERFALGVAEDADVLAFLESLPRAKRQPNLLFGAAKYLTGVLPAYGRSADSSWPTRTSFVT